MTPLTYHIPRWSLPSFSVRLVSGPVVRPAGRWLEKVEVRGANSHIIHLASWEVESCCGPTQRFSVAQWQQAVYPERGSTPSSNTNNSGPASLGDDCRLGIALLSIVRGAVGTLNLLGTGPSHTLLCNFNNRS